jgi:hypothetical protein
MHGQTSDEEKKRLFLQAREQNPTRQQADSLSHATPEAQTRSDSILKNEVETQSLPYSAKIPISHEEAESQTHSG